MEKSHFGLEDFSAWDEEQGRGWTLHVLYGGGGGELVVAAVQEVEGDFGAGIDGEDWLERVIPFEMDVGRVDVE